MGTLERKEVWRLKAQVALLFDHGKGLMADDITMAGAHVERSHGETESQNDSKARLHFL